MSDNIMERLDPAAAGFLQQLAAAGERPPLADLDIEDYRAESAKLTPIAALESPAGLEVVNTTYPNESGELAVRIIAKGGATDRPVLVFFFGGGFVSGDIDSIDSPLRQLVHNLDVVGVAPQYRLAPESPFPAAPNDAYEATLWVAENIARYGGDPRRIILAGESSGANLAAVTALRIRDEAGPSIAGQILLEPTIDYEAATPSKTEFARGPILLQSDAITMFDYYLGGDAAKHADPRVSPIRAKSLAGLPPTLVITAECDLLRDEGEAYGEAVRAAGVPARTHRLRGLIHGSFALQGLIPKAQVEFAREIGAFLATISTANSATA
ncbi:alpha/beta hydrolase [Nocardia sp. NPDC004068]|uniref:alpha/beta hydrolase n=1 Tax=Nocardia sp. NPDC004068 TaxID=3364303 RepID=UPI00367541D6